MAGASTSTDRATRVLVVLNPKSGGYTAGDVHQALERHFPCEEGFCSVLELTKDLDLARAIGEAKGRGVELVIAAGGDGTVSALANVLTGTRIPLGIIPLGTANVLARELGIPVDLEKACTLLAGPHATADIDAMQVDDQFYLTQVGIGIDALMIRDTKKEHKRRFGRAAYLWTAFTRLVGFQPRRFLLTVDGKTGRRRASQIVLANVGTLGQPPFQWGPDIHPDDGRIDVCIVRARTLAHYLLVAWHVARGQHRRNRHVRYLTAEKTVAIQTKRALPVQADGEIIGRTPIEVKVVPGAVRVAVPAGT
jgi:diacylglycerol kinase (ATP)